MVVENGETEIYLRPNKGNEDIKKIILDLQNHIIDIEKNVNMDSMTKESLKDKINEIKDEYEELCIEIDNTKEKTSKLKEDLETNRNLHEGIYSSLKDKNKELENKLLDLKKIGNEIEISNNKKIIQYSISKNQETYNCLNYEDLNNQIKTIKDFFLKFNFSYEQIEEITNFKKEENFSISMKEFELQLRKIKYQMKNYFEEKEKEKKDFYIIIQKLFDNIYEKKNILEKKREDLTEIKKNLKWMFDIENRLKPIFPSEFMENPSIEVVEHLEKCLEIKKKIKNKLQEKLKNQRREEYLQNENKKVK